MKRTASCTHWIAIACIAIVAGGHYLAFGDSGEPAQSKEAADSDIALLDVSRVFKEHKQFREQLEEMKQEVTAAEAALREDAAKVKELQAEAETLDPSEPLKQRLEDEIIERQLRIKLSMESQKKAFMNREAKIYLNLYQEVETAVADYSRAHGVKLVLRFSDQSLDEHSTRQEVLAAVNRAVVFQDGIDITDAIVTRVNQAEEGGDL